MTNCTVGAARKVLQGGLKLCCCMKLAYVVVCLQQTQRLAGSSFRVFSKRAVMECVAWRLAELKLNGQRECSRMLAAAEKFGAESKLRWLNFLLKLWACTPHVWSYLISHTAAHVGHLGIQSVAGVVKLLADKVRGT